MSYYILLFLLYFIILQNRDINLPPISNYFDPNIRVNQNFVPQPLIPQQQAAAPRLPPPPARPALPLPT